MPLSWFEILCHVQEIKCFFYEHIKETGEQQLSCFNLPLMTACCTVALAVRCCVRVA